jgi:alkylation response protein AidB-like acyl-CoA dehydrogenase
MSFVLTEEQEALRASARQFVQARLPTSHLRALRDGRDAIGFSRELWREMARLGWAGIVVPTDYGGSGLGYAELGLVLEECGRTLAPQPIISTIALSANAILLGGTSAQREEILPALCAGERILALAHEETARHAPHRIAMRAEDAKGGYKLHGEKTFVLDGHVADTFVVVARTSGENDARDGLSLFLVPSTAQGVTVRRTIMVDSRNAARVRFDAVNVPSSALIGTVGRGAEVLDATLDRATIALSAEMLGGVQEAFDRTVAYLKTRKQFGVPIGSFQALKHRAAQIFCEVELSKSIVMEALRAIDEGRDDVPMLASAAKARLSDAFLLAANEAIQMHGGVGVTDELDIGFYLKRARVSEMTFGDAAHHRDRFARIRGY